MSFKKLISFAAFLAVCHFVSAQTTGPQLVSVLHPSPNVMAMQKYGDIPVSPYTGVPNISIPVYTIKSHDITVPITLSYHASGIKVGEDASQVGLGWVLNAGGTISRNIIGEDDFLTDTYFNDNTSHNQIETFADGKGPAFQMLAWGPNPIATVHCQVPLFDKNGQQTYQTVDLTDNLTVGAPFTDFQPDQYYYNVGGLSGKFVLRRDRTVILQKQEKIKITAPGIDGTTWQIIGTDGTIYNFNNVYETNWNNNSPGDRHKSAWYLTNITSPTGNQVNFHYTVQPANILNSTYSESTEAFEISPDASGPTLSSKIPDVRKENLGNIFAYVTLHDIDYDNGRVVFNYSPNRTDLPFDQLLQSVWVYNKDNQGNLSSQPVKKDSLIHDYFTSADLTNKYSNFGNPLQRLKLTGFVENGYYNNQIVPGSPYFFYYYEGSTVTNLPPKTSFARDNWGYFNGKMNNTSFIPSFFSNSGTTITNYYMGYPGPERDADTSYTRAYSLKTIVYPTGGSTDFQYETNDFDEQKSIINDHSIYVNQPVIVAQSANFVYSNTTQQYVSSNTLDVTNEYQNSSGNVQPGTMTLTFRLSQNYGSTNALQQGLTYFSLNDPTTGNEILHMDPANYTTTPSTSAPYAAYSANSPVIILYNVPFTQQPGLYTWTVHISNTSYAANVMDAHTTVNWFTQVSSDQTNANNQITFSPGGGLRMKRIIDHDGVSSANNKTKKFIYHYNALGGDGLMHEYSFGRRMTKPEYSFWQPTIDFYTVQSGSLPPVTTWVTMEHLIRSSDSNISLNGSAEGAAVGYDQVTVLNGENGEDGETVYNYVNDPDYVPGYINQFGVEEQPPFSSDYPNILNGSLLKQVDYANNAGVFSKVKEVTNTYANITTNDNVVFGMERRQTIWNYFLNSNKVSSDPSGTGAGTPRPCDNLELFAYQALSSKFNYLFSTDEKLYNLGDTTQFVESISYFFHDNPNHLLTTRTVTINSKGEEITKKVSYPFDFTYINSSHLSLGIQALQTKNMVSAPIEVLTQKSNTDGTNLRTTSAILTSYNAATTLPDTLYQMESLAPITTFSSLAASSTVTKDPSYKAAISLDAYDANGNILQQHRIGGPYKSYAWGYNNNFPIAEMTSELPVMAYTSFEETTGNSGNNENWIYSSTLTADPSCPSGRYCYNLSNGAVNCTLTLVSTKTYVISYWTKNATAFTIAGTVSGYPKQGRTINGWTYFEHKITGQTAVSLAGTGFIDELRLYPDGAEMQTFGYDPIVGMTAMLDAKSHASHFEYDGLMRLQNIKDQDGNITKSFNYHYYDMTVQNTAVSGTYTRNNCPTNTTPGAPFTETIPANKYYSYSLASANQAAQDELLYNGQNNANIYCSCVPIIVNFSMTNQTGLSGFQAQFSGPSNYTFTFPASGSSTVQIPAGTYTLTINPVGTFANHTFVLGSRTPVVAPGVTFTNVNISTGNTDTSIIIR